MFVRVMRVDGSLAAAVKRDQRASRELTATNLMATDALINNPADVNIDASANSHLS